LLKKNETFFFFFPFRVAADKTKAESEASIKALAAVVNSLVSLPERIHHEFRERSNRILDAKECVTPETLIYFYIKKGGSFLFCFFVFVFPSVCFFCLRLWHLE
jgi:hypothetical protein